MKSSPRISIVLSILAIGVALFLAIADAQAKENVIYRFNFTDGSQPQSALISDGKGNLYGTALGALCGNDYCGYVYKLSPGSGGAWTEKVLYAFKGHPDGSWPVSLTFGPGGNLYGAAFRGGANELGGVFELMPGANGTWTESMIYSYSSEGGPASELTFDSKGNLYGTSDDGGNGYGAVYELTQSGGTWTENIILQFNDTNGYSPEGGVILDSKGNLYGTTVAGGPSGNGIAYELTPNAGGTWTENILYNFTRSGADTALTFDGDGNLYGGGGANVFELSESGGQWNETILHSFAGAPDGENPSKVVFDANGNLYGTTQAGGNGCNAPGCGIVFELSPQGGGVWKETILHQFQSATDGSVPQVEVLVDNAARKLYGVTPYGGGRYGYGTAFVIEH